MPLSEGQRNVLIIVAAGLFTPSALLYWLSVPGSAFPDTVVLAESVPFPTLLRTPASAPCSTNGKRAVYKENDCPGTIGLGVRLGKGLGALGNSNAAGRLVPEGNRL